MPADASAMPLQQRIAAARIWDEAYSGRGKALHLGLVLQRGIVELQAAQRLAQVAKLVRVSGK